MKTCNTPIMRLFFSSVIAILVSFCSSLKAIPTSTQVIPLTAGWNLISVQINDSFTPQEFQAAMTNPSYLQQIWGYNPTGNPSNPGNWNTFQPLAPPDFPSDVTEMNPGKGYWIKVSQSTSVTLNGTVWNGSVDILPGWNLVGFPGLDRGATEFQELSAVFSSSFDRIQQVWSHNNSSKAFLGYDLSAVPQLKQITGIEPGRGYWVYSISATPISLTGQGYIALPSDSDASPPQPSQLYAGSDPKYAGKFVRLRSADGKDTPYDLNNNGILDDTETQDTILYETASEAIPITIGNKGSGIVTWSLENTISWLYTAPADPRTWPAGATSRPKSASGSVSSDKDTLILYADRSGMSPGRKSGESVTLWVGGEEKVINVLIDVPEIDGDWSGFATTTRVGGKEITLGEVRLALNVFRPDGAASGAFRAVLNREQAILFPRDVFMDGIFYNGNQFKLTTNFEMPAGDRNAPPYNTFQHTTDANYPGDPDAVKKAARGDKDWNGDGKVNVMNPFPFGIRREITLIGTRTSPNKLEGSYIEAIRGMLPPITSNALPSDINQFLGSSFLTTSQPIFIEGTFVLDRKTFTPSQRSIVNVSVEPGVTFGGSSAGTRTQSISVNTTANVNGQIKVPLGIDLGQVDPTLLRITLVSPSGNFYVLHDYAETLASSYTLPVGTFTGEAANGEWQLVIEWDNTSGERATLTSWGLKIEAASTHSASGRLVRQDTGTPLPNVSINLEGGVTTFSATTESDGTFTFPQLTENDYTMVINAPGYQSTNATFFIGELDVVLGDIPLTPLSVSSPEIRAAPALGYEPLNVEFQMLVPSTYGATNISWNFGDGSPAQIGAFGSLVAPSHIYQTAGHFIPTATLSGGSLSSPETITFTDGIHVQRRNAYAEAGAPTQQIVAGIQMGSVAARMDVGGNHPTAAAFSYLAGEPQTTFAPDGGGAAVTMKSVIDYSSGKPLASYSDSATGPAAASATIYQESQWDSATFDLDRFPFDSSNWVASSALEDSDYGRTGDIMYNISPTAKGQVFIFYNTSATDNGATATDEKWDARAWGTVRQTSNAPVTLPALPASDLYQSDGTFAIYTPANATRPERLRMAVTLGGAILSISSAPSPMGDVFLFPGRTLK